MKRIGVLLDNPVLNSWQKKIINHIFYKPDLSLDILIINENIPSPKDPSLIYEFFKSVDKKMFKIKNDAFQQEDIITDLEIDILQVSNIGSRFSWEFDFKDLEKIKNYDLDVLIHFGDELLKGKIFEVSRHGVWSLHQGDSLNNPGGPPGFWEVVDGKEVTEITLYKLSSKNNGLDVIGKTFTKTDSTSFSRNKNTVFWAGVELINSSLDKLASGKWERDIHTILSENKHYSYHGKSLDNLSALKIHSNFWIRRLKEAMVEVLNPPQWFLLYKYNKDQEPETSSLGYKKLIPPKGYDWADPFVVEVPGEGFYLFFEELKIKSRRGHISYLAFNENGEIKEKLPVKVIEEKYHLSYPFIFKEKETYYMIPESANSGELWIYESIHFPNKWQKKNRIFKDKFFYDATLIKHNEYYYLFGSEKVIEENAGDQYLYIYYSKDLFGIDWTRHPSSPVYRDVRIARPAGRIYKSNGKLIRPAQIGAPKYGYGIQFNEITVLSPTEFLEIKTETILPNWEKNLLATHTFNSVGGFSVIDAQAYIKR